MSSPHFGRNVSPGAEARHDLAPEGRDRREAAFWDSHAQALADEILRSEEIDLDDPIDGCRLALMGDFARIRVLDLGCGTGLWSVALAERGAQVTGLDVSHESIRKLLRRARLRGVSAGVRGVTGSAMMLPFPDRSFDLVQGQNILHHIDDVAGMGHEVARVLRPGGLAVFSENSANNRLLMIARRLCGHWGIPKWSSPDEYPLMKEEIRAFGAAFKTVEVHYPRFIFFFFLDAKFFHYRNRLVNRACRGLDDAVYRFLPSLRRFSYRQVIVCRRDALAGT